jgi:hypothetical protein
VDGGLHDDGVEGLVNAPSSFEHARKEAALAELGNLQLHVAGLGDELARSGADSLRGAGQRAFVTLHLDHLGRFGVDQRLREEADHLANEVTATVAPELFEHRGQVKIMVGHRSIPFVSWTTHQELLRWPVFKKDRKIYTTSGVVKLTNHDPVRNRRTFRRTRSQLRANHERQIRRRFPSRESRRQRRA